MTKATLATFEVFTVMKIQVAVFWVVMMCSDTAGYWHFRRPCYLYLTLNSTTDTIRSSCCNLSELLRVEILKIWCWSR
jgi:hypothetical protein